MHRNIHVTFFLLLIWMGCITTAFAAIGACDEINNNWRGVWEHTATNGNMCQWVATASAFGHDEMIRLDIKLSEGIDNSNRNCPDKAFVFTGTCQESKLRIKSGSIALKGGIINDSISLYGDYDWLYLQKR